MEKRTGYIKAVGKKRPVILFEIEGDEKWIDTTEDAWKTANRGKADIECEVNQETGIWTCNKITLIGSPQGKPYNSYPKKDWSKSEKPTTANAGMRESYAKDILVALITKTEENGEDLVQAAITAEKKLFAEYGGKDAN